jgi:Flp pilus assembly protein TadD
MKALTLAIRHNSREKEYYRLRADAHEALGNHDKAENDQRKAQELAERAE